MPTLVRRSLFWKYAAYFAGVVSALLVISGAVGGYFAYRQSVAAIEAVQRAKAQFAATEIENFMRRVQGALHAAVGKYPTAAPIAPDDLRLELVALLRHYPEVSELHWIGSDGREQLTLSRFGGSSVDAGRDWSDDPRFRGARQRRDDVGPVYFRRESEPFVSIAAAREPGGSVLKGEVNLKYVWNVVSQARLAREGVAYVVDRRGALISHPDIGLVLRQTDLSALPQVRRALVGGAQAVESDEQARNLAGVPVVATAVPIESLGWTVFAEQPLDEAFRPVYASVARSVALVALGVALAVGASVLLARRMVRPIRDIEARARQLGEGRFDQRIELDSSDELGALVAQFNGMASRLQETHAMQETRIAERTRDLARANEAKTRFLAAASHDLRQPIHALALFVGQLRGAGSAEERERLYGKVERSVEALNELLDAVLDLSKLDVGAVSAQPRPMALQGLLSRLSAEFAPSAEAKGLAITLVPTSLWVRSDPVLLQRILLNVISNALRYTAEGRILVGCRRRGDEVDVVVADTGAGIDPRHLPHVFEEFYRAAPAQGEASRGLGLGLAIVRRLAALLGHRVRIASTPGKGTVVRISMPRAQAQAQAVVAAPVIADVLRGVRVLVIDDEAEARDAMQGLLAQWGCEAAAAATGDEAVALSRRQCPEVVLCDLRLAGDETGVQVVERVQHVCGAAIACAFITGESTPEVLARARATGRAVAFKPMTPGRLRAILEHLVAEVRTAATTE
jgi:signal transduction histidine kinase/CheY-like chemotaxis protein